MTITIGLVANVYNEANALPGWLETHLPFFDDVRVLHAGPRGEHSNDGTIELLERWRVPVKFSSIDAGFGALRTECVRFSPCDWVMILDADERFYAVHRILECSGEGTPQDEVDRILAGYSSELPDWATIGTLGAGLEIGVKGIENQGAHLHYVLDCNPQADALITIRRHWHDFSWRRPSQNWQQIPDWQLRVVRNSDSVYYDAGVRVHERLVGARDIVNPDCTWGPFFDHFHFFFKRMEWQQRRHDIAIYNAINDGRTPPTQREFTGVWEDLAN